MSVLTLMERAKAAKVATGNKISTEKWLPVVDVLRRKNWSWEQIYAWLKEQGEVVQANPISFISAMSKRYRSWLDKQALGGGR